MRTAAYLAIGIAALGGSARAATQEQIGNWVLDCPGSKPGAEPCTMRFNKRILDKGGIIGDLEIQAAGKSLVPVIVLRGLSPEILMAASLAGKIEASIQFAAGAREDLNCAASRSGYICSPKDGAALKMASALSAARSLTARFGVSMAGNSPLPPQEKNPGPVGHE